MAGGDCIDDVAPLRAGATAAVLGQPVAAMLPVLVDADEPHVRALTRIVRHLRPDDEVTFYAPGTFDAGATASRGIPTVMFGARGGDWPLGADYVAVDDLVQEARALGAFVLATLGA